MCAVLLDGIASCFVWDLITGTYPGLSSRANLLDPLISKHFLLLGESPPRLSWLTEWFKKRLQTMGS